MTVPLILFLYLSCILFAIYFPNEANCSLVLTVNLPLCVRCKTQKESAVHPGVL
jgi:hypothetical protein